MAAEYPSARWAPSPHFGYSSPSTPQAGARGRLGFRVRAIVDHVADGTDLARYFSLPTSEVSATFSVTRAGVVHQHVLLEDAQWTNGIDFSKPFELYRSNLAIPWISECWQRRINPNLVTVTVEHEGYSGQPFPAAQRKASLWLHAWLVLRLGLQPDPTTIVGHHEIDSVTRAHCPGPTFFWRELWDYMARLQIPAREENTVANKALLQALGELWAAADRLWDAPYIGKAKLRDFLSTSYVDEWNELKEAADRVIEKAPR